MLCGLQSIAELENGGEIEYKTVASALSALSALWMAALQNLNTNFLWSLVTGWCDVIQLSQSASEVTLSLLQISVDWTQHLGRFSLIARSTQSLPLLCWHPLSHNWCTVIDWVMRGWQVKYFFRWWQRVAFNRKRQTENWNTTHVNFKMQMLGESLLMSSTQSMSQSVAVIDTCRKVFSRSAIVVLSLCTTACMVRKIMAQVSWVHSGSHDASLNL